VHIKGNFRDDDRWIFKPPMGLRDVLLRVDFACLRNSNRRESTEYFGVFSVVHLLIASNGCVVVMVAVMVVVMVVVVVVARLTVKTVTGNTGKVVIDVVVVIVVVVMAVRIVAMVVVVWTGAGHGCVVNFVGFILSMMLARLRV
jgi:hypothetical protein